jgi:hypothetical protein
MRTRLLTFPELDLIGATFSQLVKCFIQPAVGVVTAPHPLGVVRIDLFPVIAFISLWCGDNTDHKLNGV